MNVYRPITKTASSRWLYTAIVRAD